MMIPPLELQTAPSCRDCLSWSEDGEIAVAAGDSVQVLTPKTAENSKGSLQTSAWHIGRFRANLFSRREVSGTWPLEREAFSIGAEQSLSNVVGVAWSPPGLATHRRSLLAVLTSNLVLSLWEVERDSSLHTRKWTRMVIINHTLKTYFASQTRNTENEETSIPPASQSQISQNRFQKRRIRSFTWLPPLRRESHKHQDPSKAVPVGPVSRWGHHLLVVTNDINDVVVLRVERKKVLTEQGTVIGKYVIDVLTQVSIHDPARTFNMVHEGSLFASALQSQARVMAISAGPWVHDQASHGGKGGNKSSSKLLLGAVYGSRLTLVDVDVKYVFRDGNMSLSDVEAAPRDDLLVSGVELNKINFTGPLHWISSETMATKHLTVGVFGGYVNLRITDKIYRGESKRKAKIVAYHRQFLPDDVDDEKGNYPIHWASVAGITSTSKPEDASTALQLCTLGGWAEAFSYSPSGEGPQVFKPTWYKQMELVKERFDIDYDLGGAVLCRIWGLTSFRGWTVVAFTVHPSDMIEYITAVEERTTLVFSHPEQSENASVERAFGGLTNMSDDQLRASRERVLEFVLSSYVDDETLTSGKPTDINTIFSSRLLYAAAACVVVEHRREGLLLLAKRAFAFISSKHGTDLSDEIAECAPDLALGPTNSIIIPAKSPPLDDPEANGSRVFEKCEICGVGIEWFSEKEARCVGGHRFVRCALTSLCIQEPGLSKFCSLCGTEYLNEDLAFATIESANAVAPVNGQTDNMELDDNQAHVYREEGNKFRISRHLFDTFDTCIYCGGKFRA